MSTEEPNSNPTAEPSSAEAQPKQSNFVRDIVLADNASGKHGTVLS